MYAPEVFATTDYNERFRAVVATINARGVGEEVLAALLKNIVQRLGTNRTAVRREIELLEDACNQGSQTERTEIEKAVAESADGDVVAAHIAFGNDILCSEDEGGTATGPSIFDLGNRAWLKAEYGVEIVNMQELAALLEA